MCGITGIYSSSGLDKERMESEITRMTGGKENNESLIRPLIVFQSWFGAYIEGRAVGGVHSCSP
jgi:hypothetical protein